MTMKPYAKLVAASLALCLGSCSTITIAPNINYIDAVMMDFPHSMPSPIIVKPRLEKIAFGSCLPDPKDGTMFDAISAQNPDLFLMLGDNVYGDYTPNDPQMSGMRASYWQLAQNRAFSKLVGLVPTYATWDDHDYGANDAGGDFAHKRLSERMFETFWNVPISDERRQHDGIYGAFTHGPVGQRVQIIILDTRFFRDPLVPTDIPMAKGRERYQPHSMQSEADMLGPQQWVWLEQKLQEPAEIRLVISSIQLVADGHGWEAWATMPAQRQKFYDLVKSTNAGGVIILSGDRHHSSINRYAGNSYPIYDFTASPLGGTPSNAANEIAPLRIYNSKAGETNFGEMNIDWQNRKLELVTKGANGQILNAHSIGFDEIKVN
ncbi:MAG: alkaline phosphatase D [Hyphomonadaceae bacterium]|nr:MAG: alkaline phosphatase D [Hyphomonadaceae bacterium]KAF0186831.1 MAG: alkaline phosphatase D [Hyphomonadaceae bacterium]